MQLARPDPEALRARLARLAEGSVGSTPASGPRRRASTAYSYPEVGATRDLDAHPPEALSRRYDVDRREFTLGRGRACFERACAALLAWRHFRDVPWLDFVGGEAPAHEGQVVASVVRVLGLWLVNPCRVVYLEHEEASASRLRFAYGTLPGHVESGEERFTVSFDGVTSQVRYEIVAFSRPALPLVRLGYPFARRMQRRFAHASAEALRRASA